MSSTSAPFGMRPIFHPSGQTRSTAIINGFPSAYATQVLMGQAVLLNTSGQVAPAAVGDAFLGCFDGVEFTDSTGRRRVSNYWPAGQVTGGTPNDPVYAWVYRDQLIEYEIQASGSVLQTKMGDQLNFGSITAGSSVTGYSAATADITTITNSSVAQMRIVDKGLYVDNDWGDAYTILRVQVSKHQDVATVNAYGG